MKNLPKKLFVLGIYLFSCVLLAQENIRIIPQPSSVEQLAGSFTINREVSIDGDDEIRQEAEALVQILTEEIGTKAKVNSKKKAAISLKKSSDLEEELGHEGYRLSIGEKGIQIEAAEAAGVFYGIQSLRQLLWNAEKDGDNGYRLPFLKIEDIPRFSWRSFMLDESRHFKGKEEVKKLLDEMALLKMNTFHWHLTDDQGWRIEIKRYPKLTEVGSIRKDTQTERKSEERTGKPHGGFYSQEEIKAIIDYAAERHIKIVPEIEMPGHAMAAIAAYPWVGSMGTTTEVSEIFGKMEDSFNIADPKVVEFLKNILDEVIQLFPGNVIHIGGDEVNFEPWKASEEVKKMMQENHLESPVDLQIFFTNQVSNYLDDKEKRMMGWNEIMGADIHEKGEQASQNTAQKLAKSAVVHFWKGDLELIKEAASNGYEVVNSNHWDTYLDYTYKVLPLSKSYAFDPIPEGLDEKYNQKIIGSGAQMWSEWIPTVEAMENQIFPRLAAYAEVGWTAPENKDFDKFSQALKNQMKHWKRKGIHFNNEVWE